MKTIQRLTIIACIVLMGCAKPKTTLAPSMSANNDGTSWTATSVTAKHNFTGAVSIIGTGSYGTSVEISVFSNNMNNDPVTPGSYETQFYRAGITINNDDAIGTVTISSISQTDVAGTWTATFGGQGKYTGQFNARF